MISNYILNVEIIDIEEVQLHSPTVDYHDNLHQLVAVSDILTTTKNENWKKKMELYNHRAYIFFLKGQASRNLLKPLC